MGILGMGTYNAELQGLQAWFIEQLAQMMPPDLEVFSFEVPSTAPSEMYKWVDFLGDATKWVGDRDIEDLTLLGESLKNEPYQKAVQISRRDLANDRLGLARIGMSTLAQIMQRHWYSMSIDALLEGQTRLCHDGKAFFADDHPVGSSTADNLGTAAFSAAALAARRLAMETQISNRGVPLEVEATHIIYGPASAAAVEAVLDPSLVGDATGAATDNLNKNRVAKIKSKRIRSGYTTPGGYVCTGDEWFLLDCSMPIKPVVRQLRKAVELKFDEPFMRNEILAGADHEGACGMTLYQLADGNFPT